MSSPPGPFALLGDPAVNAQQIIGLVPIEQRILALAMAIIALPGGETALRTAVFEVSGRQG